MDGEHSESEDLLAAVEDDRERQWTAGKRVSAEEYFRAHPELATGEAAVRLVYGEYLLRERGGETPAAEEYQRRFPALAERLARQFVLHAAIGSTDDVVSTAVGAAEPDRPPADAPPVIPGFDIAAELGRGGMAVVYAARDTRLNRPVAIKVIKPDTFDWRGERTRFRTEAEAIARLRHPHIVQIFEVGEAGGRPYMVLEQVPGGTLARKIGQAPLPFRDAAGTVELLARAVQAAHAVGVIHRDLKPANVLLAADGSPRVADFGLAKRVDAVDPLTHTGAILGTPSYMAPEQAAGGASAVGPPADVYALGAILYECLTGRPPFRESNALETLVQVRTRDPVPPSRLLLNLPPDLEAVCLKCLEKDPSRRYPSAASLADDLRRWLDGEPTLARPGGVAGRIAKLIRRNPVVSVAVGVTAAAIVLGVAVAGWYAVDAANERASRAVADEQRKTATLAERAAEESAVADRKLAEAGRRANYSRLLGVADRFWQANAPSLAEEALDECPEDLREGEWHYRRHRHNSGGLAFRGTMDVEISILTTAASPDGKLLVTGSGDPNRPERFGSVVAWDSTTGERAFTLGGYRTVLPAVVGGAVTPAVQSGPIYTAVYQPNAPVLVTASRRRNVTGILERKLSAFAELDGEVTVWDVSRRAPVRTIPGAAGPVAFSADGRRFAACTRGRIARVWDVTVGEWAERPPLPDYSGRVDALALSPDGRFLAVAGSHLVGTSLDDAEKHALFEVRDLATGRPVAAPVYAGDVTCLAFTANGKTLVAGCLDGTVRRWDAATWLEGAAIRGHANAVNAVAFTADGTRLATAGHDHAVKVWDWATGDELRTYRGHDKPVNTVAFIGTPDGERLVSGGADGYVRVWDVAREPGVLELVGHRGIPLSAAFSPDRPLLASVSRKGDQTVRVWDTDTGRPVFEGASGFGEVVAFGKGGLIATGGGRTGDGPGELTLWDLDAGKPRFRLTKHTEFVTAIAFSPDGKRLVSAGGNARTGVAGRVRVWDTATGEEVVSFAPAVGLVSAVAFSPDGHLLAVGGWGNAVAVCDPGSGREQRLFANLPGMVGAVAFSPDGATLAVGDHDGLLTFRDLNTGDETRRLRAHRAFVRAISYHPSGRRVATVSLDITEAGLGEVRVWDTTDFREVLELPGEGGVAFSPDGTRLAAPACRAILDAPTSRVVRVWDLRPSPLVASYRSGTEPKYAVAADSTGRWLAGSGSDGVVTLWDRTGGSRPRAFVAGSPTGALDVTADGRLLAAGSHDGVIHVWDTATGELVRTITGHDHRVTRVKFAPTGTRLVCGDAGKHICQWDLVTGERVYQFDHPANDLAATADGRRMAVCGGKTVTVFDPAAGRVDRTLPSPRMPMSVAFGDGLIAVGDEGGEIRVWETTSWTELGVLTGHHGTVFGLAFGPGNDLYSAGGDHTVRVWDVGRKAERLRLTEHTELVRAVIARGDWLATAGFDDTVRVWKPKLAGGLSGGSQRGATR